MHLYLSPHLDDAVYSCGGQIYQRTQAGEDVVIVTLCAGDPPAGELSPFAESLHQRWKLTAQAADKVGVAAVRREEDRRACALLGARAIHLSVPDCIYRRVHGQHIYASEDAIFGRLHPDEAELIETLAQEISQFAAAQIYAPLSLGMHVDHQLTRHVAEQLPQVIFYEDYPYAARTGWTIAELLTHPSPLLAGLTAASIELSATALEAKVQAMAAYASQLSSFWRDVPDLRASVRDFAELSGGERVWQAVGK